MESSEQAGDCWTVKRLLFSAAGYLRGKGIDSGRLDAELLLAHALDCDRVSLYRDFDKPLSQAELAAFRDLTRRRARHEPIAYILGSKEFFGRQFAVNNNVLIPRPETEVLVETALSLMSPHACRVLDVGTGSGCIAVSLAKECAGAVVEAWDISDAALAVAENNALQHAVAHRVFFAKRDMLVETSWCLSSPSGKEASQGVSDSPLPQEYVSQEVCDIIVSNPPYIAPDERASLPQSVRCFEPEVALFADNSGLAPYEAIGSYASRILKPGGHLVVETSFNRSGLVREIFLRRGWLDVTIVRDYARRDRIVTARRPNRVA